MQTLVKLATLASIAFTKAITKADEKVFLESPSDDTLIGTTSASGRWDLLKNGSKYDMLVTLSQETTLQAKVP